MVLFGWVRSRFGLTDSVGFGMCGIGWGLEDSVRFVRCGGCQIRSDSFCWTGRTRPGFVHWSQLELVRVDMDRASGIRWTESVRVSGSLAQLVLVEGSRAKIGRTWSGGVIRVGRAVLSRFGRNWSESTGIGRNRSEVIGLSRVDSGGIGRNRYESG